MLHLAFSKQDITARRRVEAVERVFDLPTLEHLPTLDHPVTVANVDATIFGAQLTHAATDVALAPPQAPVDTPVVALSTALAAGLKLDATRKPAVNLTQKQQMDKATLARACSLQRDIVQGQSLVTLATQPMTPIPHVNLLSGHGKDLQQAILSRVHIRDRADFEAMLSSVPLGIFLIVGFVGSGKTDLMATTILLAVGQGPVIVCTPTHAAASNIAARVTKLAGIAYGKAKEPTPIVIRGFSGRTEERQVKSHCLGLGKPETTDDQWDFSLSLVQWMLRIFEIEGQTLSKIVVKPALRELVNTLRANPDVQKLRQTLIDKRGYSVANSNTFRDVATRILAVADVVCCTTYASTQDILAQWTRNTAKFTFLDEAGAMSMPEALMPWFDGRPLVMAGDVRQLPPCVMTSNEKTSAGRPLNYFEKHQEISALERLMRMQWPCWGARRQNRIVKGGFDLAKDIFYPDLGEKFEYAQHCAVEHHPVAAKVEMWLRGRFPAMAASPSGKILPAFINCVGTSVTTIGTSRSNSGQAHIALALMKSLMRSGVTRFVVVSLYRATKTYLEDLIKKHLADGARVSIRNSLKGVEVSTTDSFQGKEEAVAIFLTTVTKESGPGVVKDPRRFNVGVTRHTDFLFVVGDIATMDSNRHINEAVVVAEEGGWVLTSGKKMRDAYQWFRTKGRVVTVNFGAGEGAWFK